MARGSQVPKDKQQLNWNVYVEDIIFRTVGKRGEDGDGEDFFCRGQSKGRKEHYAAERVLRNIVDGGLRMTKPPHAMS